MTYSGSSLILGTGTVSAEAINAYFRHKGPEYAPGYAPDGVYRPAPPTVGQDIIAVAQRWGINHDVMAAQIMHESAAWQSRIVRDKNNPSGLGAVDNNAYNGAVTFPTPFEGIRATAAHLMTYAEGNGEWTQYDPRAAFVPVAHRGTSKTWSSLGGRWATDSGYGGRVVNLANALVSFANDGTWNMAAQIPGFTFAAADSDHYERGRREPIRGGAQHYTAGTDSLAWLRSTSTPPVSVHFLIKHNPTLEDRGWQLVRIEDTAWTTAFANPYTVAIEYEHKQGQAISDAAYQVLAITWREIAAYVKKQGLGEIPLTRAGIRGHKEWVNNPSLVCPDGIDVDRIVREAQGSTPPPAGNWPTVPPSIPDPRPENPFGDFWIPKQFAVLMATQPLNVTGYVMESARGWVNEQGETLVIQHTERQRYELRESGEVTLGRLGAEALGGAP